MLTHGNIVANLLQVSALGGARAWRRARETVITALPLYHIFALTGNCLTFMKIGAKNILIPNPRDMPGFVAELAPAPLHRHHRREHALQRAHEHAGVRATWTSSGLKMTLGGGMAVQRAVAERWKQVTKTPLRGGLRPHGDLAGRLHQPAREGRPLQRLRGPAASLDGRSPSATTTAGSCPSGETGEICIAGPQVMKGYWNRPDETAKVMFADGAFRTGDIGLMDERGYVKIVDRKKDMILVSGFNVYPNEVEDVVAMMPGVLEVCAVAAGGRQVGRGGARW